MSIEVQSIYKTYGDFNALKNVTLKVAPGELVALLGPSGSGKTTLLRVIAGMEQPDPVSGPVLFHGQDVSKQNVGARQVGFVFQHYALFKHMTVFENVAFGLNSRPRRLRPSKTDIRDRVHELLNLVMIQNLAGRYPSQLSGGQRQRVALARALAVEPRVLLLDEPFGALDARVRRELRRWLRKLHDDIGITTLFVTHDQEEALEVADRVVVMNSGVIEQVGTPEEVFDRPSSTFVMDFLGQVNLFKGRVEQGKAVFGDLVLDSHDDALVNGRSARLYVRPHHIDIGRHVHGHPSLRATISRILAAGPVVKLELAGHDGQLLYAEIPHERFRELGVSNKDEVYLSLRETRVFVDDFSI